MVPAFRLRYYCNGTGDMHVTRQLGEIKAKWGVDYDVADLSRNGQHDWDKNREVYERDFKPRARILKRRTGESITRLRSHSGNYFVAIPGTLTVVRDGLIEWFAYVPSDIHDALEAILKDGPGVVERLLR